MNNHSSDQTGQSPPGGPSHRRGTRYQHHRSNQQPRQRTNFSSYPTPVGCSTVTKPAHSREGDGKRTITQAVCLAQMATWGCVFGVSDKVWCDHTHFTNNLTVPNCVPAHTHMSTCEMCHRQKQRPQLLRLSKMLKC